VGEVLSPPNPNSTDRTAFERLTEEYVAFIYANFLVTVLLRMRSMVVGGIGMYVCMLLALSTHPFSPSPTIFLLGMALLLLLMISIGAVYAQMHREATLSRLTETPIGELGADFWVHFLSAGALPVLALLTAEFPAISRLFNSMLQPILQSVK
jgi:hypothetical protein